jgi:hypothetical protein
MNKLVITLIFCILLIKTSLIQNMEKHCSITHDKFHKFSELRKHCMIHTSVTEKSEIKTLPGKQFRNKEQLN